LFKFVELYFFDPITEILVLTALDAASINTGASAFTPDFAILDERPFLSLSFVILNLGFLFFFKHLTQWF
jgi:hypothetical protein